MNASNILWFTLAEIKVDIMKANKTKLPFQIEVNTLYI